MRLTDVDALIEKYGDWYVEEGSEEGFIGILRQLIDEVPTINAIPVEWIFEQMQILYELHNKNEYVLQWLMELWQKEQEAQDHGKIDSY